MLTHPEPKRGIIMLVDKNEYMTSGAYIGMKTCTPYMKDFLYKVREDGLGMFNLEKIDYRICITASFLSRFDDILVVSRKDSSQEPIDKFAQVTGTEAVTGRFPPGMLTNPSFRDFKEPEVIMVVDPIIDEQAVREARRKGIPVVSLANTFNTAQDVDLIIPINNNGRKSLALVFWLLAREMLKKKEEIEKDEDFKYKLEDFGYRE